MRLKTNQDLVNIMSMPKVAYAGSPPKNLSSVLVSPAGPSKAEVQLKEVTIEAEKWKSFRRTSVERWRPQKN